MVQFCFVNKNFKKTVITLKIGDQNTTSESLKNNEVTKVKNK